MWVDVITYSLVQHMATQYHQPQFIRGDNGSLEKVVYQNPLSSDDKDSLCIERRKFFTNSHSTLFTDKYTEVSGRGQISLKCYNYFIFSCYNMIMNCHTSKS